MQESNIYNKKIYQTYFYFNNGKNSCKQSHVPGLCVPTIKISMQVASDRSLFSVTSNDNRVSSAVQLLTSRSCCGPVEQFQDRSIASVGISNEVESTITHQTAKPKQYRPCGTNADLFNKDNILIISYRTDPAQRTVFEQDIIA